MSFQYPSFLWALSVLAIPVIIHLFNFRKTTRIYFSNTQFLRQVKQETTQKRKLKQLLVLASRLLFLFFLVMAFAQPFLPAKEQLASQRNISLYLDNSYSMSVPVAEKTRALDAGISYVNEIVSLFPGDTRYRLLTNDFAPFSNSFKTKSEITDLLSQVRLSPISRTAAEITKRSGEDATLFWISDLQKSTFGAITGIDSAQTIRLVPISYRKPYNVFVDTVFLENPFVIGGEKNSVHVRLRNNGDKKIEGLVTKLIINKIQAATASITIEPNSFTETTFDLATGLKGNNEAMINFSDFPVSFDNDFYFTLNYTGKVKVTEIKPDSKVTYVEQVYGNKELFAFRSFSVANINYSLLAEADVIIINGLNKIEPALASALLSYKNNFGTLIFIPGTQPDFASYKSLLSLPALSKSESDMSELEKPDFQNPFFENVFEEKTATVNMPRARKLLDWGTDRSAILKFKDGRPFLSQQGKTFVLASPLDKDFTDLYNHALFVPIMYRMAASGKKTEQKQYYSLSASTLSVPADSLQGEEPAKLVGAQEIVPSQRKTGDRILLEIPKYSVSPGFYKVAFKKDTLDLLAFNLDKNESVLAQYTGEEVKTLLGSGTNISIFKATSTSAFTNEIKERYIGTPLWKYALLLALFFLLAEVLLIRFLK